MIKEQKKDFSNIDYRFSFVLTINDSENKNEDIIICKRDFNIYNLDEESLYSLELKETIDDVVNLIDRDLKSKSRVYMWYNYDENYPTPEFTTPIGMVPKTTFKFTFFDGKNPIISKIWSGDGYPFPVRNSVDLTNRKYKYDNRNIEMDFSKQVAQKGASGRPDLTSIIMRHISSTCASYRSKQRGVKNMYKQYLPELSLEDIVINPVTNQVTDVKDKLEAINLVVDDNGHEKVVYEVYSTYYDFGEKEYDLSPIKQS
jgi:hypothetical protein